MAIFKGFTKMAFLYERLTLTELNILKEWIETKMENRKGFYLQLARFVEHDDDCEISQTYSIGGRPTKDGGYEQLILGKWYQVKPIDESPKFKCTCGLDNILKKLNIKL